MADGGSTSSSNSGRANDQPEIPLPSTIWIDDIDEESEAEGSTPTIPKVPSTMKSNENLTKAVPKWSEPNRISIGPYHFRECYEDQKLKTKHTNMFIKESQQKRDDLYRMIDERTPELKMWYEDCNYIRDEDLKAIFLVDGCFLLNFINYSEEEDGLTRLGLTNTEMVNIKRDAFLLENQLPYAVLKLLLWRADLNYKNRMEEKIRDFVVSHAPLRDPRENYNAPNNLRSNLLPEPQSSNPPLEREDGRVMQTRGENRNPLNHRHLLHLHILLDQRKSSNPEQAIQQEEQKGRTTHRRFCRTVSELSKVGVSFKPIATGSLTDISFQPDDSQAVGCLLLPRITLNTFTMTIFLNLIAFESSNRSGPNSFAVISYLYFMDSLIGCKDDMKALQTVGILHGDTKHVARFLDVVYSDLKPNWDAYKDVIQQIESHVQKQGSGKTWPTPWRSKWRKRWRKKWSRRCGGWCIEFKRKYFSSPWTFIALIAGITGLALTATQVYYAVHPRQP